MDAEHNASPSVMTEEERATLNILPGVVEHAITQIDSRRYVGAAVDQRNDGLIFYWYGDVPDEIAESIAEVGEWVEVRPVPYPTDLLFALTRWLMDDPHVRGGGIDNDGFDALTINVVEGTPPADVERLSRTIPIPPAAAVAHRFPDVHGVRVTIKDYAAKAGVPL